MLIWANYCNTSSKQWFTPQNAKNWCSYTIYIHICMYSTFISIIVVHIAHGRLFGLMSCSYDIIYRITIIVYTCTYNLLCSSCIKRVYMHSLFQLKLLQRRHQVAIPIANQATFVRKNQQHLLKNSDISVAMLERIFNVRFIHVVSFCYYVVTYLFHRYVCILIGI